MRRVLWLMGVLLYGMMAIAPSVNEGATQSGLNPLPGHWRGLHLLNYQSDAALKGLGEAVPALAEMGVNVLILEVNSIRQMEGLYERYGPGPG